jgi:exopolysaccharide biosynthesis predicted pyruvyltransferase EpsI
MAVEANPTAAADGRPIVDGERATSPAAAPVIQRLSGQIRLALEPFARRWSHCALIDFPNHSNVGDNAIWLGEIAWLADANIRVRHRCDLKSYRPGAVAESLEDDGVILIHGGGNLGDLWPRHQRLREQVIRDFPDRPIVQLPQTIHFSNRASLASARAAFDRHPDFTLLARDQPSLTLARNEFRARSLLCPDMAFCLGRLPRPRVAATDIFWLRRTDIEAVPDADAPHDPGLLVSDWLDGRRPLLDRARRALRPLSTRLVGGFPRGQRTMRRLIDVSYDWQAHQRVRFGCRLLASGRVVITDRLHAHILCLLLGIPHVVLDNSYGKLRRFCETWNTLSSGLARCADTPAEALAAARALLDGSRGAEPGLDHAS